MAGVVAAALQAVTRSDLRAAGMPRNAVARLLGSGRLPARPGYARRRARELAEASGHSFDAIMAEVVEEYRNPPAVRPAPPRVPRKRQVAAPPDGGGGVGPPPPDAPVGPVSPSVQASRTMAEVKLAREKVMLEQEEIKLARTLGELVLAEDVAGRVRAAGVELRRGLEAVASDVLVVVPESAQAAVRERLEAAAEVLGARVEGALLGEGVADGG